MDYPEALQDVATLLGEFGKPAVFSRAGVKTGAAKCVELSSTQEDDANSLLAQTAYTSKSLLAYPIKAGVQVGDTVVIEKQTYTVRKVDPFRPATVTLYLKLEVV